MGRVTRRRALGAIVWLCLGSCTTITTIEVGECDFYIAPNEPVTLTYELVKACQALDMPVRVFTIEP